MLSLSVFLKKSLTCCLLRFFSTHISKVICGISNVFVCVVWYPSDRQVYRTENKFNKGLIFFFLYIFYISNLYFIIIRRIAYDLDSLFECNLCIMSLIIVVFEQLSIFNDLFIFENTFQKENAFVFLSKYCIWALSDCIFHNV